MLTTYFGGLGDNLDTAMALPVAGLHLDLVRAPEQLDDVLQRPRKTGAVARRHRRAQHLARRSCPPARPARAGCRRTRRRPIQIAPSCSLLHVPHRPRSGNRSRSRTEGWLAFAVQKLERTRHARQRADGRTRDGEGRPGWSAAAAAARQASPKIHDAAVDGTHRDAQPGTGASAAARSPSAPESSTQRFKLPRFPDHDHRLVPADRRSPQGARRARQRRADRRRLRRRSAGPRPRAPSAGRRISGSTCWCMASSSATTWWSILASSLPASPSPSTAGCSPMARAASARRCFRRRVAPPADDGGWWQYAQSLTKRPMKGCSPGR